MCTTEPQWPVKVAHDGEKVARGVDKPKAKVSNNDKINARIASQLPDRMTGFAGSADWQEGHWDFDSNGAVLHC